MADSKEQNACNNREKRNKCDQNSEPKCDDKESNSNKSNASISNVTNNSLRNGLLLEEILNQKKLVLSL